MRRIVMWSGPRNLSTAMMRSFSSRTDTWVSDEPFYAAYLAHSGQVHPMQQAILDSQPQDPAEVARQCLCQTRDGLTVHYQKHMTHHMLDDFALDWINDASVTNVFLIRHPARVIASYNEKRESPSLADLGFEKQLELFQRTADRQGHAPAVVDADQFLTNPAAGLKALCTAIDLPFQSEMLAWPVGPHPDDGAWAPHWYDSVWNSTGFKTTPEQKPLPTEVDEEIMQDAIRLQSELTRVSLNPLKTELQKAFAAPVTEYVKLTAQDIVKRNQLKN